MAKKTFEEFIAPFDEMAAKWINGIDDDVEEYVESSVPVMVGRRMEQVDLAVVEDGLVQMTLFGRRVLINSDGVDQMIEFFTRVQGLQAHQGDDGE